MLASPSLKVSRKLQSVLEEDGWDALIADLGDQMAINLTGLGYDRFDDSELRACCDIPDEQVVSGAGSKYVSKILFEGTSCDG